MKPRFKNIINLFVLSTLLFSGACQSDIADDLTDGMDGFSTIGYMAVRLMPSDGNSRASVGDTFDMGTNGELLLSNEAKHYAIFYTDGIDTPIAISEINGMTADQSTDQTANSSMVYAAIVGRNELREMLEIFNNCYVILNTNISTETLLQYSIDDLLDIKVDSPFFIDSKGNQFFTMCNSVYVENGQKKIQTYVDTSKIYSSYNETIEQAWKGNAAVTAYVERLAAKFTLSFENENYNLAGADRIFETPDNKMIFFSEVTSGGVPYYEDRDAASGIPYTYKIRITGWGLNALEQTSYLFRNFNENSSYFDNWYNPTYKRAYWSEDINYGKDVYPWQYRKVIDNSGIPVYEGSKNILKNLSFEELNANRFTQKYMYAPENTYDFNDNVFSASLNSKPELLAGTHVVVCAQMLTNIENPTEWMPHDVYRDRNGSFYRSELDCVKALVASMNNTLKSHSYLKFTYWDWSEGGVEHKLFASTKGNYALYYKDRMLDSQYIEELYKQGVSLTADAEFKGSDGKRILWIDGMTIQDDKGNVLCTYSNIDEVNSKNDDFLRESTVNDMKSVIFENIGPVDHFADGKMYYAVPIGYVLDQSKSTSDKQVYSIYGVVRNSCYNMLITGVSGLGTSVDNVNQPIIPNTVSSSDHLFIGFDILEWHPIDQTVKGEIK